jgi:glycogen debranching enzyme
MSSRRGRGLLSGRIALRDARRPLLLVVTCAISVSALRCGAPAEHPPIDAPALVTGIADVDSMYRLALGVVRFNASRERHGMMPGEGYILHAGQAYPETWTRDAAYNNLFAVALISPEMARNSLLCEIMRDDQYGDRIGNANWYAATPSRSQYWDAIVWLVGAWEHYLCSGDATFLDLARRIGTNSIRYFEDTAFDEQLGLFDGPASYGDGVSAYPPPYADAGGSSFILDTKARTDGRFVMKALSTNCLYYRAYRILGAMAALEGGDPAPWLRRADALREAINRALWLPAAGRYAYFLDMRGRPDAHMEAMGHAMAIIFGVADSERTRSILAHQYISPNGIPCVWPVFPEYGTGFARHCGTVWPHAQGLWAWACADARDVERFASEFFTLTRLAKTSGDFREIYHPVTGKPFGGVQIGQTWESQPRQTWSATAYLAMVYHGVFGIRCDTAGIAFAPMLTDGISRASLTGLRYRGMKLDIGLRGAGTRVVNCRIDGVEAPPFIACRLRGRHRVEMELAR